MQENERLSDQYYEAKRQLDISRAQFDAFKYEAEKELQDVRDKLKSDIQDLQMENQALH